MVRQTAYPEYQKLFSALEIPFHEDESVNYTALSRLIEYELEIGVEGFYCMGSSGEGLLMDLAERKNCLEAIVKTINGRVPVIAHIGTIRTKDVITLAKHAMSIGVDTVSMIPPYYYRFSIDEITQYYEEVIRAVPGLRVIIYNIPQFTGVEFSKTNAKKLLDNPAVIGVKHTSTNLYSMERMIHAYPGKVFFNGFDEQFLAALAMGADATIGTTVNCYAPLFHRVRDLYRENKMEEAYAMQQEINKRVEIMVKHGIFSAVKYMLTKRGVDCGACRKPFAPLSQEAKRDLDKLHEEDKELI